MRCNTAKRKKVSLELAESLRHLHFFFLLGFLLCSLVHEGSVAIKEISLFTSLIPAFIRLNDLFLRS
jgi:hypothetical protein